MPGRSPESTPTATASSLLGASGASAVVAVVMGLASFGVVRPARIERGVAHAASS